jgi:hypothetical protein
VRLIFAIFILLLCSQSSQAYSILTHEALIDASWAKSIYPLLKLKYPFATEEQLKEAHAYAYGGAIAPDMGYFPFGSRLFTDLVHYVRSGDFVNSLLDEAHDINEYAFALGCLCHYMADQYGHSLGTNKCVPMVYPNVKIKYGDVVTYDQDHISHKRMEFGFDVLETVNGNYTSMAYHDLIGFKVSRPVLERAFAKTYGLDINDIFGDLSLAIETFRWSVTNLFPLLTRSAWVNKQNEIRKLQPTATSRSFRYKLNKADYYTEFGKKHRKPGLFAYVLSFIIRVSPKLGPLKSLKFKVPGPDAEKIFIQSFDTVLTHYTSALHILSSGNINLANIDFDTGNMTAPGEYPLTDRNYELLLLKLRDKKFVLLNYSLKENILDFYAHRTAPVVTKKNVKEENKLTEMLGQLKLENRNSLN